MTFGIATKWLERHYLIALKAISASLQVAPYPQTWAEPSPRQTKQSSTDLGAKVLLAALLAPTLQIEANNAKDKMTFFIFKKFEKNK